MSSISRSPLPPLTPSSPKPWLLWVGSAFCFLGLLYGISWIYLSGHTGFAITALILCCLTFYIYLHKPLTAYRYVWPGLVGIGVFIIFPLIYTVNLGLTNYSSSNLLDFDRAKQYLLEETVTSETNQYDFSLHATGKEYRLQLRDGNNTYLSAPLDLGQDSQSVTLSAATDVETLSPALPISAIIKQRNALKALSVTLPDGQSVKMQGLRRFALSTPRYREGNGDTLVDIQTGQVITPNFDTGFYEDEAKTSLSPGFTVSVGLDNYYQIFGSPDLQKPFLKIFVWTVVFSALTVLFTLIIGITLAVVLDWEPLHCRGLYRTLLFLPYAVPGFISILVFKGLFNENFGEINHVLNALFGISPGWFSDPVLAKVMLLIVNTWLGFPYIMILCTGLLKSISRELYEATAIEGCGALRNFWHITLPLIIKPLSPLLIASFAFNFNNFVLISLLTGGRPDFIDTQVPAGTTDLLVTYTYRIAFEDSGQNFGLAAAISTVIFLMVAVLSLINLKLAHVDGSSKKA